MKTFRILIVLALLIASRANAAECVVLVHGLGRTHFSLFRLQIELKNAGYFVVNNGYASTGGPIEELAAVIEKDLGECRVNGATPINFVTHSVGGILVRQYLQNKHVPDAKRVVMLGPPNHGSEVVDRYKDKWWFKFATGPAGQQLGTEKGSLPNKLGPLKVDVGIIAGTQSYEPWFSSAFEGPNDGKVSVKSTKLPEMKDIFFVDSSHTFMPFSGEVSRQVKAFLISGQFDRNSGTTSPKPVEKRRDR